MSDTQLLTVTSGSGLPPALLRELDRSPQARPLERNLARLPSLFVPDRGAVQPSLGLELDGRAGSRVLYQRAISVKWAEPLSPRHQLFIANATNRWIRDGCPEDRTVRLASCAEAARDFGYAPNERWGFGGPTRTIVTESLSDIIAVAITSAVLIDGEPHKRVWGLLETADVPEKQGQPLTVTLHPWYADLIRAGFAFANVETFRRLVNRNQVAARLWSFLEVEQGVGSEDGFWYPLFGSAPGETVRESWTPAIADLLGMHNHADEAPCHVHQRAGCHECHPKLRWHRKEVARRTREGIADLIAEDPRYAESTLTKARAAVGMWSLHAKRQKGPRRVGNGRHPIGNGRHPSRYWASPTERAVTNSGNEQEETNSDSSSLSSTGKNPILDALKEKGWKGSSESQLARVREVARHRKLGNDDAVAQIIADHYPGRDQQDLFVFLKEFRKPPRPLRTVDDIPEPPPLLPLEIAAA